MVMPNSTAVEIETGPLPVPDPNPAPDPRAASEKCFLELRRKVQDSELLSSATERLLQKLGFNGRLSVVIQHGRVVKSGYEEGYFRRKNDLRLAT